MDDLIASIIARLDNRARIAMDYSMEQASAYQNAAKIVREAWNDEQAKIAEEERHEPTAAELRHSEDPDMYPLPTGTNHYTDTYPSGRSYAACGEPHPSPESIARRCSREAGHGGPHVNRWGNEWTAPDSRDPDDPDSVAFGSVGNPEAPGYATDEKDMDWHADSDGKPCACIEEEHEAAPRMTYAEAQAADAWAEVRDLPPTVAWSEENR